MTSGSRQILWSLVGNAVTPASGLILSVLLARSLGAAGRGEVAAVTAPVLLAVTLAAVGLPESVTFHAARGQLSRTIRYVVGVVGLLAGAAASVLLVLVGPTLLSSTGPDLMVAYVISALTVVPSLGIGAIRGVAAARHMWALITAERIGVGVMRLALVVGFAAAGELTPYTAVLIVTLTPIVSGIVYVSLLRSYRGSRGNHVSPGAFLSYGGRVWIGSLSGVLLSRVDQAVMAPLVGVSALGVYAVAVSVAEVPAVLSNSLREVYFSRAASATSFAEFARVSRVSSMVVLVFAVLVGFASIWLLPVIFGTEFAASTSVVWILLVGVVIGNPGALAGAALSGAGFPGVRSVSLICALGANVLLLLVMTPLLGIHGAALATVGGTLVAVLVNVLCTRRIGLRAWSFIAFRFSDLSGISIGRFKAARG